MAIGQKKGRAISSAEVQQGGKRLEKTHQRLSTFHLGWVLNTFKEKNVAPQQSRYARRA